MPPTNELRLSGISSDTTVFWSRGNAPTQKTERLDARALRLHFVATYLLADKLIASASFYFESPETRKVTQDFAEIFRHGDAVYFVDESMDGFHHHGRRKREKSPASLHCYHDRQLVDSASDELKALGHILRRPDKSVSEGIARLWSADLISSDEGTLGFHLSNCIKEKDRILLTVAALQAISTGRGDRDFVWELIAPILDRLQLPQNFRRHAKRRLAQFYSIATGALLGIPIDSALRASGRLGPQSRFDTTLFLECMEAMSLTQSLSALDAGAVVRLKKSSEFLIFREFYFSLVDAAAYNPQHLAELLPLYARAETQERLLSVDRDSFIYAFSNWFKQLKGNSAKYEIALHKLLTAYDAFGSHVIRDLSAYVSLLANPRTHTSVAQLGSAQGHPMPTQGVIDCTARDIYQIHIHQSTPHMKEETSMSTNINSPRQVIADVTTEGSATQTSEHLGDIQEIRRAEILGNISQTKTASPEMSFGGGKARGYGIFGLVLVLLGVLAYKYFSAQ